MESNEEQIQYWNEKAGPTWVERQVDLDRLIDPLGRVAIDTAAPSPGEQVLDVGCGTGQTTVQIADRVKPRGSVLGLDASAVMLSAARLRPHARTAKVHFLEADAQTVDFSSTSFDLVFSRFGVMFFTDPEAAFSNLRRGLEPGGRLTFLCWQSMQHNPWVLRPMMAISQHLELPPPPPSEAPGPFSLADPERIRRLLGAAGYGTIKIRDLRRPLVLGDGSLDSALGFLLEIGPTARVLAEAQGGDREAAIRALRDTLEAVSSGDGVVLDSACWLVEARCS